MAEYGVLLWRDSKPDTNKVLPDEYDLVIDLDDRISPQSEVDESKVKLSATEKIIKDTGTIDTLTFNTLFSAYKNTDIVQRQNSELVINTFIDRCIARLSDSRPQENIDMAVHRTKADPRRVRIGINAKANYCALRVTHSTLLMRRNVLQTVYVERVGMCTHRSHLLGSERLMSQMMHLELLNCIMGKIIKDESRLSNLTEESGASAAKFFFLEMLTHKLTVAAPAKPFLQSEREFYNDLLDREGDNSQKRYLHHIEHTEGTDLKHFEDDLEEEIQDLMKDTAVKGLALIGRKSRYFPEIQIACWKHSNTGAVKNSIADTKNWKDLNRLPNRFRGIFACMYACIPNVFETISSPDTLKMVAQPDDVEDPFWKTWLNEIPYRQEEIVAKRIEKAYGELPTGCAMERVIMYNYIEIMGFMYNLVGRLSNIRMKKNLYPDTIKLSFNDLMSDEAKDKWRAQLAFCDKYLAEKLIYDDWDEEFLGEIRACMSIPVGFILILRRAFGLEKKRYDPEEVVSDLNLVITGSLTLETFLETYVPDLSGLVSRANSMNGVTTISDMLQLLCNHNLLIILLATFGEVGLKRMYETGVMFFKKYKQTLYLAIHVMPRKSTITHLKGLRLSDFLIHCLSNVTCEEHNWDYQDQFEGEEQDSWRKKWEEYGEEETKRIEEEAKKLGENGEAWKQRQIERMNKKRTEAFIRYTLRSLVIMLFSDLMYSKRMRTLDLAQIDEIHHLRKNYTEIQTMMGCQCNGFTDVVTIVFPVTAPHRALMVFTIYSEVLEVAEVLAIVMRRFPNNFTNIYQHVLIRVSPSEISYNTKIKTMKTKDRVNVKTLGPMSAKTYIYHCHLADARAIILKGETVQRGSNFFFVKLSGSD
ncbi:outer capsid protein [Guangxi orbivirus]|uniref:outer capsid protein n=1 Tax=Guangxi orbivirus TaxID=2306813 RepID=UPI000E8AE6B8|nr:outer capsid protein [Guangxi orbivirus]AXS78000.1 outer capsid protein [Guangxi orbivirus]